MTVTLYDSGGYTVFSGTMEYNPDTGFFSNADGSVHDGESNLLGNIEIKTGKVTDAEGTVLGYANGISIQRVAAYYFFDFFKNK